QVRWRQTALSPLYALSAPWQESGEASHDAYSYEQGGLLFLVLDNSRQEISREQLRFFRGQILRWIPTVLVLHVPLSVSESLRPFHGYALCGDPAWGRATDRSWEVERREPFPERSSASTVRFLEAVLAASAPRGPLVAVLAGHVHAHDATPFPEGGSSPPAPGSGGCGGRHDCAWGGVQYVGLAGFQGGYRLMSVETATEEDVPEHRVEAELRARLAAAELLAGLAVALLGAPGAAGAASTPAAASLRCWGGAPGAAAAASLLDVALVVSALGRMLLRTEAAVRHGFHALAEALRPLLRGVRGRGRGPVSRAGAECLEGGVLESVGAALEEWADPRGLRYQPGSLLELRLGCSILWPLNDAIGAWKHRGDFGGLGEGLGQVLLATACEPAQADAGA
ncbi:unnamed protein product, partial [Prorocentrum cordatum]